MAFTFESHFDSISVLEPQFSGAVNVESLAEEYDSKQWFSLRSILHAKGSNSSRMQPKYYHPNDNNDDLELLEKSHSRFVSVNFELCNVEANKHWNITMSFKSNWKKLRWWRKHKKKTLASRHEATEHADEKMKRGEEMSTYWIESHLSVI